MNSLKKFAKFFQSKIVVAGLLVLLQLAVILFFVNYLANKFVWYYALSIVLAAVVALDITNANMNTSFKLAWTITVLIFPVFGTPLYLIFSKSKQNRRIGKRFKSYREMMRYAMPSDEDNIAEIAEDDPEIARNLRYIEKTAFAPVYKNTSTKYFSVGEEYYTQLLRELNKAERFIFIEYFIIEPGKMLNSVIDILKEKVSEGVEAVSYTHLTLPTTTRV